MNDKEKFKGFKKKVIEENEKKSDKNMEMKLLIVQMQK